MADITKLTKAQLIAIIQESEENKFESFKYEGIRKMVVDEMQSKLSQFQYEMVSKTQYEAWKILDESLNKLESEDGSHFLS